MQRKTNLRKVATVLALTMGLGLGGSAFAADKPVILYSSLGEELSRYELDVDKATLEKKGSITLEANLQFAAFHPSGKYLYAVSSDAGSGTTGAKGTKHRLSVFKLDPATGSMEPQGEPALLPERPIHVEVDKKGEFVLVAFNQSGTVKVYKIGKDGRIGEEVAQAKQPDGGIFTHQVTVTPSNQTVIALGRGNEATATKPADIGSTSTFKFEHGQLTLRSKTLFEEGVGPRHLAYHPQKPWVYVGIERGSMVFMYPLRPDGTLSEQPLYKKEGILNPENVHRDRQKGGCIQIHPNGKFLYVTNRADGTVKEDGKTIWAGGENNIAVFAIDEKTGEPTLIQHVDGHGIEGRTFAIDPSGKLFVLANQKTMLVKEDGELKTVPAKFSLFKIQADGKLEFIRSYDVNAGSKWLLWMDIMKTK